MAAKFNCMTHALRVEHNLQSRLRNLDMLKNPIDSVIEMGKECKREVRQIASLEDPIATDEWRIVFWGWVVSKKDYDGFPVAWDYHFVLQNEDGTYTHRMSWDSPITKTNIDDLIYEYNAEGYKPFYFAVRELEE